MPTVSATRTRQAPLSLASRTKRRSNSGAAREASCAPTETRPNRARASPTISGRPLHSHDLSLPKAPRSTGDTGNEMCTASTPQSRASSRSRASARHQAVIRQGRPRLAMARRSARSSSSMAGVPASNSGTPAAASAGAMAHFSGRARRSRPAPAHHRAACCRSDGPGFGAWRSGDEQRLGRLALGERVQHFVDALFVHLAVPMAFGIDHDQRPLLAELEAPGARYRNAVETAVTHFGLQVLHQPAGILLVANSFGIACHAKTSANENVMFRLFHDASLQTEDSPDR